MNCDLDNDLLEELWAPDLKPLQHTFLVTFLNVVFRNDRHPISRLHYIVKRKRLP